MNSWWVSIILCVRSTLSVTVHSVLRKMPALVLKKLTAYQMFDVNLLEPTGVCLKTILFFIMLFMVNHLVILDTFRNRVSSCTSALVLLTVPKRLSIFCFRVCLVDLHKNLSRYFDFCLSQLMLTYAVLLYIQEAQNSVHWLVKCTQKYVRNVYVYIIKRNVRNEIHHVQYTIHNAVMPFYELTQV
jgi:hypothetical protein